MTCIIASATLLCLTAMALVGAGFVVKLYSVIFIVLLLSIAGCFLSLLLGCDNAFEMPGYVGPVKGPRVAIRVARPPRSSAVHPDRVSGTLYPVRHRHLRLCA